MKKFKFLVFIDDDHMTNRFHEIILEQADVCEESMFFDSALKAIDFFNEEAKKDNPKLPDYIFLDINMPRMNGWEFLDEYTKMSIPKSLAIVMLSTSVSTSDKNKAKEYEVVENFLSKPLSREVLNDLLKAYSSNKG